VQHLTGVGTEREQRVQAKAAGVAVTGTLLVVAVDLADRGVHIDHQWPITGTGTRLPRPGQ
jgi:hypothetical protein